MQKAQDTTAVGSESGFSLIETVVAMGLAGVVLLGAAEGMSYLSKGASILSKKTLTDTNKNSFGKNMTGMFTNAYVASQFQHLPISVDCPTSTTAFQYPCVRLLQSDNTFTPGSPRPTSGLKQSHIEFFRDDDPGEPGTGFFYPAIAWTSALLQSSQPIDLLSSQRNTGYYATWPLIADAAAAGGGSPPLVMLQSSDSQAYFKIDETAEGTTLNLNSFPYAFFKSTIPLTSTDPNNPGNLKGTLLLIYNSYSPKQFSLQLIKSVIDCTPGGVQNPGGTTSPCDKYVFWTSQSSNPVGWDAMIASWVSSAKAKTDIEYALELVPLTASSRFGAKYQPLLSSFNVDTSNLVNWGARDQTGALIGAEQNSAVYSFPTEVSSIYDPSDSTDFPNTGAGNFDVRRMQHYYDGMSVRLGNKSSMIVGLPVKLTAYYLRTNTAATSAAQNATQPVKGVYPPGTTVYSLVSSTYNQIYDDSSMTIANSYTGDPEQVLLEQLNDKVIFGRQLGDITLSIFTYQQGTLAVYDLRHGELYKKTSNYQPSLIAHASATPNRLSNAKTLQFFWGTNPYENL